MTSNVGNGLAANTRVTAAIRDSGADIVGIQELNRSQANRIMPELATIYPYTVSYGDSFEGRGLVSRFPVTSASSIEFVSGRPDVVATIDLGSMELTVIIGHPRPQTIRRGRVRFSHGSLRQLVLLARAALASSPAVLLGDFNMSPRHPGYQRYVNMGLIDAYRMAGSGRGWTFPTRMKIRPTSATSRGNVIVPTIPIKRFDYIWTTPDVGIESASIGPDTGADHASVLATLVLPIRNNAQ